MDGYEQLLTWQVSDMASLFLSQVVRDNAIGETKEGRLKVLVHDV
jgi:hypothetical protein